MGVVNVSIQNAFGLGGISFNANTALSDDSVPSVQASVPAAKAGTVTTHASNTDVVLTMASASHGIANTDRVDLYWAGGFRRGMVASNVSGTSVELTGGTGTNAPAVTTAIVACKPVKREFGLVCANLTLIAAQSDVESLFTFLEADDTTEDYFQHLVPVGSANVVGMWYSAFGANPLTGTRIESVYVSHADVNAAHTLQVAALAH